MSYKRKQSSSQGGSHSFNDIHCHDPQAKRTRLKKFDSHRHHLGGPYFLPDTTTYKFPYLPEWVHDSDGPDSLGATKLEVEGLLGFRHVRCPRASKPCPANCGRYACHVDSLIIASDGACPHNGTPKAIRSSYGVFFGSSDEAEEYNRSRLIPGSSPVGEDYVPGRGEGEEKPHTSQRAELWGAIMALDSAKKFVEHGGQWVCDDIDDCIRTNGAERVGKNGCKARFVVIKSDSAYLVNSITEHVKKWRKNGWQTAKKTPVANQDLWNFLLLTIMELGDMGASVAFWLVPRDENEDADELANSALEEDWEDDDD